MSDSYRTSIVLDPESNRRVELLAEKTGESKATILRAVIRSGLMTLPSDWGIPVDWDDDGEDAGERAMTRLLDGMKELMMVAVHQDQMRMLASQEPDRTPNDREEP